MPVLKVRLAYLLGTEVDDFELNFFVDAAVCTIERWLMDKDCMPPDEFITRLLRILQRGTETMNNELNKNG